MLSLNVEADPIEAMNLWISSGPQHAWYIAEKTPATPWEARIDELERIVASSGSRDERKKAFDEVQQIVVEQQPIIYLVTPDQSLRDRTRSERRPALRHAASVWWNVEWLRFD